MWRLIIWIGDTGQLWQKDESVTWVSNLCYLRLAVTGLDRSPTFKTENTVPVASVNNALYFLTSLSELHHHKQDVETQVSSTGWGAQPQARRRSVTYLHWARCRAVCRARALRRSRSVSCCSPRGCGAPSAPAAPSGYSRTWPAGRPSRSSCGAAPAKHNGKYTLTFVHTERKHNGKYTLRFVHTEQKHSEKFTLRFVHIQWEIYVKVRPLYFCQATDIPAL